MKEIKNITVSVKSDFEAINANGRKILEEMTNLSRVTQEISYSMNEMTLGIQDINSSMQLVKDKTTENMDSINKVNSEIKKFKV